MRSEMGEFAGRWIGPKHPTQRVLSAINRFSTYADEPQAVTIRVQLSRSDLYRALVRTAFRKVMVSRRAHCGVYVRNAYCFG